MCQIGYSTYELIPIIPETVKNFQDCNQLQKKKNLFLFKTLLS